MAFYHHRAFVRPEGTEEEITPPCVKTRSFDSLSVAAILQGKLDPTASAPSPLAGQYFSPPSPGSPTIDAAAAVLAGARSSARGSARDQESDGAVDCLMSLAALGAHPGSVERGLNLEAPPSGDSSDLSGGSAARRRLKMARPAGSAAAAASGAARPYAMPPPTARGRKQRRGEGGEAAPPAAAPKRPASQHGRPPRPPQPSQLARTATAVAPARRVQQQHERPQTPVGPSVLSVSGMERPVKLLSGASIHQLKLLSAAFKLCPNPNATQMVAIATRVDITTDKLQAWFQSRQSLEQWVVQQPHLRPADIAKMFFDST